MSKRPLPPVQGMAPIERGVGPIARTEQPQRDDTTEPELAVQRPADEHPGGPAAAPDGTFTPAGSGGTQLVPTGPAAPAQTAPLVNEQELGGAEQGEVYTVPPADGPPRAEDIIRPKERIEREQISAMVPAELRLVRRMRLLWAHEGIEQRDLVALAVDRELRSRGY